MRGSFTAELDGFNVQAAVRLEADDDEGRERRVRYCARPCAASYRISLLPDGRVAYGVKYGGRGGTDRRDDASRRRQARYGDAAAA